jgi:hypothetical protein
VRTAAGEVAADGCLRPGTTAEVLATLAPAFRADGSVTAGTSSPLTDGASACLVTTPAYAARHGLEPLASVRAFAVSGCDPEIMGIGPIEATRKLLARAGLTIEDIDLMELNEAFASQAVAVIDALGIDPARVNLDGGAIAIGRPLRGGHAVHRWRAGHRDPARGGLISGQTSAASSVISTLPLSARETGQPSLAAAATFANPSASMPLGLPRTVSATREMVGAPSTISNVTVAETSRWSGVAPASASSCENAIA